MLLFGSLYVSPISAWAMTPIEHVIAVVVAHHHLLMVIASTVIVAACNA